MAPSWSSPWNFEWAREIPCVMFLVNFFGASSFRVSPCRCSTPFKCVPFILNRLIDRATRLQSEKVQKEAEVQGLMAENVRLNALLDKKEAQLLAMNEQCKFMALRKPEL